MKKLRAIDQFLSEHFGLLCILLWLVLLRIPNFFEPYWYGDEAIYLTIGNAMRHGERLYSEIIDHKTPIIYYLAMVPNQLWFRVLNLSTMAITTMLFYFFAQKLFAKRWIVNLVTLIFMVYTTVPWFEGNIPNGELFVMFFVMIGATLLAQTEMFQNFLQLKLKSKKHSSQPLFLLLAGFSFGLAILTKVPAVFDAAAFFSIGWFAFADNLQDFRRLKQHQKQLWQSVKQLFFLGVGVLLPIAISIIYFIARGSGQAYLDYGLLYNFHYVTTWSLPFQNHLLLLLFSLKGKIAVLGLVIILLSFGKKFMLPRTRFLTAWFILALVASLLSNRPYPHYFLQVLPPLILLVGELRDMFKNLLSFVLPVGSFAIFIAVIFLLHVGFYQTGTYYVQFLLMATKRISTIDYRNSFNSYMADDYAAAKILQTSTDPYTFVWGDNEMVYALSQKIPVGRFTAAFHIDDFKARPETMVAIAKHQPNFIVMMNNAPTFSELQTYISLHYHTTSHFEHFTLWKRN